MLFFLPCDFDWKQNIFVEFYGGAKIKLLMSQHMKRASGVEIVLLNNNFSVIMSDVCVLTSPRYLISFAPTVSQV